MSTRAVSAVVAILLVGLIAPSPSPAGAEATGGCRPVGGGEVSAAGPNRATVVVDTGSGTVWSACITFEGTISGLEALQVAASSIGGLAPVFEPYAGEGGAVCRLLGVGNDPPNCLSKTVEYWAYFRNGVYARGGGSNTVVRDGDVEGWAFGRGTPPRAATAGAEAIPASALPATTTTSFPVSAAPADPTTPDPGATSSGGGSGGPAGPTPGSGQGTSTSGDVDPAEPAGDHPADGATTTTEGEPADGGAEAEGSGSAGSAGETGEPSRPGGGEAADAAGTVTVTEPVEEGSSSVGSILGFGGALGVAGLAFVLVRRRRQAASPRSGPASLSHS